MLTDIIEIVSEFAIGIIESTSYYGISFLMALESANLPIPSEVVMPFAGFLVARGELNFWLVVLAGTLGNVLGSWISYELGYFGGKKILQKCGRFVLIHESDIALGERWFKKYGSWVIFFTRLTPVVRTFISFPAGIARMNRKKFLLLTFFGSLPWNFFLAYIGFVLGENWEEIGGYFRTFDWLIVVLIVIGALWWVQRHIRLNSKPNT